jgi:toxin ParE1/3/4
VADIVLSRRARDDFRRIWRYIAEDNERAADAVLLALDAKIERLRVHPEMGVSRSDIRPNARALFHKPYLVLYEYHRTKDVVEIVAIVEGMRDLGGAF